MTFDIVLFGLLALFLTFTYYAYRGVKRGSPTYHKRGIVVGLMLLSLWAGAQAYFYFRDSALLLDSFHIPLLAVGVIAYSAWKRFSASTEGSKEPIQPLETTRGK